jgi:hypothetical protein
MAVSAKVAARVAAFNKDDLYFGFAVPHYRELLTQKAKSVATSKRQSQEAETVTVDVERLNRERKAKQVLHRNRLQHWKDAEDTQRSEYLKAALQQAPTSVAREQILNASLETPPAIVLRQIPLPASSSLTTSL